MKQFNPNEYVAWPPVEKEKRVTREVVESWVCAAVALGVWLYILYLAFTA